jgi:hypothetical protein
MKMDPYAVRGVRKSTVENRATQDLVFLYTTPENANNIKQDIRTERLYSLTS